MLPLSKPGVFFFLLMVNPLWKAVVFDMIRTHSGITPLSRACNTTVFSYTDHNQLPSITSLLDLPDIKEHELSPLSRVTMKVIFLFHARVTEVLNVRVKDILYPDRAVCRGIKHSHSYVVYLPGLSEQIHSTQNVKPETPLFPVTYLKLYRDAVRVGINYHHKNGTNVKRLHSARYAFCKSVSQLVKDSELAGLLRHKSNSSFLFYQP